MKVHSFKRVVCLLLAIVFVVGTLTVPALAAQDTGAANTNLEETKQYLEADGYEGYLALYEGAGIAAGDKIYSAQPDLDASAEGAYEITQDKWRDNIAQKDAEGNPLESAVQAFREGTVYAPADGGVTFTVDIDAEGMYFIVVEYYTVADTVNNIERKLFIDDKIPFKEAARLSMTKTWAYSYYTDEKHPDSPFVKDLNNNDLTPPASQVGVWRTYVLSNTDGYSNTYQKGTEDEYVSQFYQFYMLDGTHTLRFESIRESVVIGSVKLVPVNDPSYATISYEEYLAKVQSEYGAKDVDAGTSVKKPAELPVWVSDSSVVMSNNKSSSITQIYNGDKSSPVADLYNVIGATSYSASGQWAAYDFEVTKTGLYNISLRYLQNVLDGMFVSRAIKLTSYGQGTYQYGLADGTPTIPFTEAYSTRYNYDKDWNVQGVNDGTTTFKFYFEEGVKYTVYLEVSLGALADQLRRVENALAILNECYLQIIKLTGTDPDEYRDYGFKELIPDTVWYLNYEAVELQTVRDEFAAICNDETGAHLANLDNVIRLLATMGTDEYEIAKNLSNLKNYLGTLGTWISDSKKSTLLVDYITINAPAYEHERANANFFQSVWYEIRAFFASFTTNYDLMGVTDSAALDEGALAVWHATGRDQNNVVRNLVDTYFPDYCASQGRSEVPVALKLVTGATLLPSILAGSGPDVYIGLDAGTVMNYAIRDAVLEVSDQPDFNTVKQEYHEAALKTVSLLGDTYAIPQSMNFMMMFYRIDSLVELGAAVPETWDELLSLLPMLQANNMEIGLNYGIAWDSFLYQAGGTTWKYMDDPKFQGAEVDLDSDVALSAFEFCCSLYTDYSFPVSFDVANRFRTGEMPIAIGDYTAIYNTLIVYATELAGLWSFSHVPGTPVTDTNGNPVLNEDGTQKVNYTAMANVSTVVIPKSGEDRKEDAWQFVKWSTSAGYISEYANRMVAILGPSAKYAAANLNALDDMSWTSQEVAAIREQMAHLDAIVSYPGRYYIDRHIQFAFLDAVNNGTDPVEALRGYISTINDEVYRKRKEFEESGLAVIEPGETYEDAVNRVNGGK